MNNRVVENNTISSHIDSSDINFTVPLRTDSEYRISTKQMSWCLCCAEAEEEEEEVDRVELAFQRMDINRDGHLTYAEFRKVTADM